MVHLLEEKLNNDWKYVLQILYKSYYPEWKKLDAIHLLNRHDELGRTLNETSIQTLSYTHGEICQDVLARIKPYLKR